MNTVDKYREYVNTHMLARVEPVVVDRAEGCVYYTPEGKEYLDCFAGIAVVNAGHCNPKVIEAAKKQMDKLVHCCAYVYYSPPVGDLAEKLHEITPGKLKKTFFSNSGAEANEGAMRIAKQFTKKTEFLSLQASFHGRTSATLAVTGNRKRKQGGAPYVYGVSFAPTPYCYRCPFEMEPESCGMKCAEQIRDIIEFNTSGDVAAFIAEPAMGEGGIIIPPDGYFKAVKKILDEYDILFIADEVQSGFGRTGYLFAIDHYGVEPDIITMAKGIADGFPISAFITRDEIAAAFKPGDHLSTFGGNPISCAAALANIEYLMDEDLCRQSLKKGEKLMKKLNELKEKHKMIGDVRGRGLMVGIELIKDEKKTPAGQEAGKARHLALEKGLLVGVGGVYGNVIRFQPPLVITEEQLDKAVAILDEVLSEL